MLLFIFVKWIESFVLKISLNILLHTIGSEHYSILFSMVLCNFSICEPFCLPKSWWLYKITHALCIQTLYHFDGTTNLLILGKSIYTHTTSTIASATLMYNLNRIYKNSVLVFCTKPLNIPNYRRIIHYLTFHDSRCVVQVS